MKRVVPNTMTRFFLVLKNHSDMKPPRAATVALARSRFMVGSISRTLITSPDLNPIDYSISSILEANACALHHGKIDSLQMPMEKAWADLPQRAEHCAVCVPRWGVTWIDT